MDVRTLGAVHAHAADRAQPSVYTKAAEYGQNMGVRRTHFELKAAELSDVAALHYAESHGATTISLRPHRSDAVGVVLYLIFDDACGTVALEDPAAVPVELGEDLQADLRAIDAVVAVAVEGRAVSFRLGRGGCVEDSHAGRTTRSWMNAWPWPGWRKRAKRTDYGPYR